MSERFRESIKSFRKYAPEIETGIGAVGLVGMAGASIDPKSARETSEVSPIGLDAVADAGNKLGLSDQAVFATLTIFFGLAAMHGVSRIRRRINKV